MCLTQLLSLKYKLSHLFANFPFDVSAHLLIGRKWFNLILKFVWLCGFVTSLFFFQLAKILWEKHERNHVSEMSPGQDKEMQLAVYLLSFKYSYTLS